MGMSEFYGNSNDHDSKKLLESAIDRGVRLFDTADVYGYGHNEKLLGDVLRNHPARSTILLATKGGILRDSDRSSRGVNTSPDYLRIAIDRSIDRLGTPIDLYYLHRVEDNGKHIEESMHALAECLSLKKIRAIGLSEVSAATIELAHSALLRFTNGQQGLTAVQTEYSLMTRHIEADGVDEACRRLGIFLVAYSPICRGLLANLDFAALSDDDFRRGLPRFSGPNLKFNQHLVEALVEIAQDEGATPAQVALAWVLSRGPHIIPIPGTRSPRRLDENLNAAQMTLSKNAITRLEETFAINVAAGSRYSAAAMQAYGLKA